MKRQCIKYHTYFMEIMEAHRIWEFETSQQPKAENQNGAWLRQSLYKDCPPEPKGSHMHGTSECLPKSKLGHAKIPLLQNVKTVIKGSLHSLWMRNKGKQGRWWFQPAGMKSHRILLEHGKRVLTFCEPSIFSELVFNALSMLVYLTYTTPYKVDDIILIL